MKSSIRASVCITTFNESNEDIEKLLKSLKKQTLKPEEIILVDATKIINYQFPIINKLSNINFQFIHKSGISRSAGRNLAVKKAKNEIIAMTDVGCAADKNWLKNIAAPFLKNKTQVVAGFYKMTYKNPMQKAMRVFMGIMPNNFDNNFLPSTRSIAFTKSVWKKVGGFSENLNGAAEDTDFNYKLIKNNVTISRVKSAIVEWGMPETIFNFQFKIFNYAKGDAKTKILIFPTKGLSSHNIKVLFVFLRYIFTLLLLALSYTIPVLLLLLAILVILYFYYSYRKSGPWGIPLQIATDLAVMAGFVSGIIGM